MNTFALFSTTPPSESTSNRNRTLKKNELNLLCNVKKKQLLKNGKRKIHHFAQQPTN